MDDHPKIPHCQLYCFCCGGLRDAPGIESSQGECSEAQNKTKTTPYCCSECYMESRLASCARELKNLAGARKEGRALLLRAAELDEALGRHDLGLQAEVLAQRGAPAAWRAARARELQHELRALGRGRFMYGPVRKKQKACPRNTHTARTRVLSS